MTRAPFVTAKAPESFSRQLESFDTTIGWRFVNPQMKAQYGIDSMPETSENVAADEHPRANTTFESAEMKSIRCRESGDHSASVSNTRSQTPALPQRL